MTIIDCVVYAKSTCKSIAPSRLSRVDCQVDFPATLVRGRTQSKNGAGSKGLMK